MYKNNAIKETEKTTDQRLYASTQGRPSAYFKEGKEEEKKEGEKLEG